MTKKLKTTGAKPRIFLRCGSWAVAWDAPDGQRYARYQLHFMTANSIKSVAALEWVYQRNRVEGRPQNGTPL